MGTSAERIALQIDSSANVAEVAKARSEVSALGEAAKKSADVTRQAWQEAGGDLTKMAQVYQRLTTSVQTTTTAVAEQTVVVKEAEVAWTGFSMGGRRMQMAFVSAAFAGEAFTRSMEAGDGALRRVFRSISMLGFLGGPELGIATTAIAAIGDSMIDMWSRSEKAAKSAQVQFQKTLETLGRQGFAGTAAETQTLYSGDPFARRGAIAGETDRGFQIRSQGVRGLEQEMARLKSITQDNTDAWDRAQIKIRELQPILDAQTARWRESLALQQRLLPVVQERARFELDQLRARAALRDAQRLRPEEVPLTIGNLAQQERAFGITGRSERDALGVRGVSSIDLEYQRRNEAQRVETESKTGGLAFRVRTAPIVETAWETRNLSNMLKLDELSKNVRSALGNTLADSLAAGITAGFKGGGIKGAFAAAGKTLLAGLGGIFIDLGKTYLEYSGIMEALTPLLGNPFTAGYAGAAIGAALIGLGAALEGVGQKQGGGGGGYAGNGGTFTPNAVSGAGGTTVIIQMVDPYSRAVVNSTIYEITRAGVLNTPIVAPYGRPS